MQQYKGFDCISPQREANQFPNDGERSKEVILSTSKVADLYLAIYKLDY